MDQCSLQALPLPANEHVDFVAIDFETASGNPNSACSVGLAFVVGLEVIATTHRLIKPPGNKYEWGNVRVHGIRPRDTVNAPDFLTVWQELHPMLVGKALIAHNARFDMSVIKASLAAYGDSYVQQYADFKYVDSIAMARDLVPGRKNLAACSECLGIDLEHHHNAECDAVACAEIAIACIKANHCLNLGEFCFSQPHVRIQEVADLVLPTPRPKVPKTTQPRRTHAVGPGPALAQNRHIKPRDIQPQVSTFDTSHPLYQKSLVFTGELSIDRKEAMQRAVNVGAVLRSSVSRRTDFLVVGHQYDGPDGQATISNKEEKARAILAEGKSKLRLLDENEFFHLLQSAAPSRAARSMVMAKASGK